MSSRALRRAQRELEEKRRLDQLAESEDDEEVEKEEPKAPTVQRSAFAMLGEVDDEDEDEEKNSSAEVISEAEEQQASTQTPQLSKSAKSGKKKKKKKNKAKAAAEPSKPDDNLDEIDRALQSLSESAAKNVDSGVSAHAADDPASEVCKLLAVNLQGLHPGNEMRRLFGRATFEDAAEAPAPAGRGRRAQRAAAQQQMIGIAGAVNRRNTPGGIRGLAALALKRNIFVQGKDTWPGGSSGGLSMEIVEKNSDGTIEYAFVHSQAYHDTQVEFHRCVKSMDPERMIALLQKHPYHAATLLQVSEIAKQERDHSTAGDLLERALFSFGRAVHSSFSKSVTEGRARMDFRREENREFWLAVWRYMSNLVMRGTHRTVYEWAKLLLSMSPREDPYGLHLVLDQYAIRARQLEHFLSVYEASFSENSEIKLTPNMSYSASLALLQQFPNDKTRAQETLRSAVEDFPWLAVRLINELGEYEIPPSIWGNQPNSEYEKLIAALYSTRAKDLWSNPEATAFLLQVCKDAKPPTEPEDLGMEIDINIARHVVLSDTPAFIALLPREYTRQVGTSSDPLPPLESNQTYQQTPSRSITDGNGILGFLSGIQNRTPGFLTALRNMMAGEARQREENGEGDGNGDVDGLPEELRGDFPNLEDFDDTAWEVDEFLDALMERAETNPDPRDVLGETAATGPPQDSAEADQSSHGGTQADSRRARVEDAEDEG